MPDMGKNGNAPRSSQDLEQQLRHLARGRRPPPRTLARDHFDAITAARDAGVGWDEIARVLATPEPSIRKAYYRLRRKSSAQPARPAARPIKAATPPPAPPPDAGAAAPTPGYEIKTLANGKKVKVPAKQTEFRRGPGGVMLLGTATAENLILDECGSKDESK